MPASATSTAAPAHNPDGKGGTGELTERPPRWAALAKEAAPPPVSREDKRVAPTSGDDVSPPDEGVTGDGAACDGCGGKDEWGVPPEAVAAAAVAAMCAAIPLAGARDATARIRTASIGHSARQASVSATAADAAAAHGGTPPPRRGRRSPSRAARGGGQARAERLVDGKLDPTVRKVADRGGAKPDEQPRGAVGGEDGPRHRRRRRAAAPAAGAATTPTGAATPRLAVATDAVDATTARRGHRVGGRLLARLDHVQRHHRRVGGERAQTADGKVDGGGAGGAVGSPTPPPHVPVNVPDKDAGKQAHRHRGEGAHQHPHRHQSARGEGGRSRG